VLDEAPPKASAQRSSAPPATPAPDAATDAGSPTGTESKGDDGAERKTPQPRYDSASFDKWVTNNPEKAAELIAKKFKTELKGDADAWKKHFIAFENKRRRAAEADEQREAALVTERETVEKMAKEATEPLQPILDVIEAEQKEDYPAVDRFIEATFGISFQEYATRRLRGLNKKTPTERQLEADLAKAKEELAKAKAPATPEPAKTESKAPKVSGKWLDSSVPGDHGVRDLKDWDKQVETVYQESFDGEDYEMTVEEAADQVLKAFMAKRAPKTEAAPPRRTAQRRPPKREEDDDERTPAGDVEDTSGMDWSARVSRALKNAEARR
jgi:hypothetical protein